MYARTPFERGKHQDYIWRQALPDRGEQFQFLRLKPQYFERQNYFSHGFSFQDNVAWIE